MYAMKLVYIATLGWRIVSQNPDNPQEAVASFEEGVARLVERANPDNRSYTNGVAVVQVAETVYE